MITKDALEQILRVNGVTSTSSDEEIRAVLVNAKFSEQEVNSGIATLKQTVNLSEAKKEGLHKVFRTSQSLAPREISQLLGIEVSVGSKIATPVQSTNNFSGLQYISVWVLSVAVAMTGLLTYMYMHDIGFFHPASSLTFNL